MPGNQFGGANARLARVKAVESVPGMMTETAPTTKKPCLWHAADGRCASCKARRIRNDVMHLKDYEMCSGQEDYATCGFYKEKPEVPPKG